MTFRSDYENASCWLVNLGVKNLSESLVVEITVLQETSQETEGESLQSNVSLLDATPNAQEFETPNISLESNLSEENGISQITTI